MGFKTFEITTGQGTPKPFAAVVHSTCCENPLYELDDISKELKDNCDIRPHNSVLFDLLLCNGIDRHRFASCSFDGIRLAVGALSYLLEGLPDKGDELALAMWYKHREYMLNRSTLSIPEREAILGRPWDQAKFHITPLDNHPEFAAIVHSAGDWTDITHMGRKIASELVHLNIPEGRHILFDRLTSTGSTDPGRFREGPFLIQEDTPDIPLTLIKDYDPDPVLRACADKWFFGRRDQC